MSGAVAGTLRLGARLALWAKTVMGPVCQLRAPFQLPGDQVDPVPSCRWGQEILTGLMPSAGEQLRWWLLKSPCGHYAAR